MTTVVVRLWVLSVAFYIAFVGFAGMAHADECDINGVKATIFLPTSTAARCEVKSDKIEYMLVQVMDQPEGNRAKIAGLLKNPHLLPSQEIRLLSLPEQFLVGKTKTAIMAAIVN